MIHKGALLAACTVGLVTDDGEPIMDICNVKLLDGREGRFVSMPAEKGTDQKWYSVIFIKHKALREQIQSAVIAEYERRCSSGAAQPPAPASAVHPQLEATGPAARPACLPE